MNYSKLLFPLCFAVLLSVQAINAKAQLFGPKFRAYIFKSPEKRLAGVRKVAVLNFDNRSSYRAKQAGSDPGTKIADYLTAELIEEYRGATDKSKVYVQGARTNVYSVVERSQLDKVLHEQQLNVSGAIDENQAVEVGKLLGVDAIILGSVSYTYKDKRDKKQRIDKDKKKYWEYWLTRTATTEARMKIVDTRTAQVLGTKHQSRITSDRKTSRSMVSVKAMASPEELASRALRDMAPDMVNYFTPYFYLQTFPIEKIRMKSLRKRAREARDYLKNGEIDKAYMLYKAIFDEDTYNPKVAYNVGTIYEAIGNYEKAVECYNVSRELEPDEKDYIRAYKRAKTGLEMVEDLKSIGIHITPKNMEAGGQDVLKDKVELEGSSSDRQPIYAEPNKSSAVVAKVPGGLKLTVLAKEEGWYLVKLPLGNKQGYVHEDDIDQE